ncbi:MAG: hypothetical protein AAF191_11140 [Verrucomicrobiota bacterium]
MASTNVIHTNLQITEILPNFIERFARKMLPINAFSSVIQDVALKGENTVQVPFYGLDGAVATSRNPGDNYFDLATDSDTDTREIVVDKQEVVALSWTVEEKNRNPVFDPVKLGQLKADALAVAVSRAIFADVVPATFTGTTLPALTLANFDYDDVSDLAVLCDTDEWDEEDRSIILNAAFYGGLRKDVRFTDASASGSTATLRSGEVGEAAGFSTFKSNGVRDNGVNLVGLAVHRSAHLTAFAPLERSEAINSRLIDRQVVTDEASGLTLEFMHMVDEKTMQEVQVVQVDYGHAKGDEEAIKPLVKA